MQTYYNIIYITPTYPLTPFLLVTIPLVPVSVSLFLFSFVLFVLFCLNSIYGKQYEGSFNFVLGILSSPDIF